MSPSTLSIWQEEFIVPPDSDLVSFTDISIPAIADVHDWQGWAWIRSQPTWIEAEHTRLAGLDDEKGTHLLLLQSKSDASHQIAIYPVSSFRAQGTLTGRSQRDSHPHVHSPLRLRGRRTSSDSEPGRLLLLAVSSRPGEQADSMRLVEQCVEIGRQWAHKVEGKSLYTPSTKMVPQGPLDKLSFCTWTSLGETTRPTLQNLTSLCQSIHKSEIPIKSFLIDAGWQSINNTPDTGDVGGDTIRRKLVAFEAYEGLGAGLGDVVGMIKRELSGVEDVGVWMTLGGFWCAIDKDSPLVSKYSCKPYPISRSYLPGIPNRPSTISYLPPTSTSSSPHVWYLPPPTQAYRFWSDWFSSLRSQGITWVKVDNQASLTILSGREGVECMEAMWEGMVMAAEEVFGPGRVLHCMAHSERMFNGKIGLGLVNDGRKIVNRNTDDYGRTWLRNPHQDHIFQNLYSSILTSQLDVIPDGDMFMSLTEAPVHHAILRALMPGPILLTDKAGQHDLELVRRFLGVDKSGQQVVLKTSDTVRPLANRVFQSDCRDGGNGRALVGSVYLPESGSSILAYWNARENAPDNRVYDQVTRRDLLDSGVETHTGCDYIIYKPGYCSTFDWAIWDPTSDVDEIMPIELNHLAAETVLAVPLRFVEGKMKKVAICGLIDKFAGLAAVSDVKLEISPQCKSHASCRLSSTGRLGIVITGSESLEGTVISLDNQPVEYEQHPLDVRGFDGPAWLVTIEVKPDLQNTDGGSNDGDKGWRLDVTI